MKRWQGMKSGIFVVILIFLSSCERRPLEDEYTGTVVIPVSIDWSVSNLSPEEIHRASVWLFPKTGGQPLEFRLEGNITYREIRVPIGSYSVLVFNETTDSTDWNSIMFRGTDKFKTFAAFVRADSKRGFYVRSETLPLVMNPDMLAAWSLDNFVVTDDMKNDRGVVNLGTRALTGIQPTPRVNVAIVTAYVVNLKSVFQATGLLEGMADGVLLASGERFSTTGTHAFILTGREYDPNNKDGTVRAVFNTFGKVPNPMAQYGVQLDLILTDGTGFLPLLFDVTGKIESETENYLTTLRINLGIGDFPIVLPELDVNAGITVDDWEEVITPLK